MDKLKKGLKHLFAPAIVLLLVAVMGVFSPVVSVVAALRLNPAADEVASVGNPTISNLPARTVKVGSTISSPQLNGTTDGVKLWHANKEITGATTYHEIGKYEWRFYIGDVLFDTYTVNVTDATYTMTMPNDVVTVAPKGLSQLELPLPATYTVDGNTMEVGTITASDDTHHYAIVPLKKKKSTDAPVDYQLSVKVALENVTLADDLISIDDQKVSIDLTGYQESTGTLKVTYFLSDGTKTLVAVPLNDIEIKNVKKSEVTFAKLPTAPSVSSLAYYSNVALTAPAADSAKVNNTTFAVEAQTKIVKVQAYLYSKTPSDWSSSKVKSFSTDANGKLDNEFIEIDGLNVKVKALGCYRFQFQTTTLFGYKMAEDSDVEQDNNNYVRYWSDSVLIRTDSGKPNFAWVDEYNIDNPSSYTNYEENFADYLDNYTTSLPLTEEPNSTASKKITVNPATGLTLPAIFPHDNATAANKISVYNFYIKQIKDENNNTPNKTNAVYVGTTSTETNFVYNMGKRLQIKFAADGIGTGNVQSENNEVVLKRNKGLYQIHIVLQDEQPKFQGSNEYYSAGSVQTVTKDYYFYLDGDYQVGTDGVNSPKIDENNRFQVSDVYLCEGHTFDFVAPSYDDANTPTDKIVVDYYLVDKNTPSEFVKLDYQAGTSRISVDLDDLRKADGSTFNATAGDYYIYAVARNFNGMQANLQKAFGVTNYDDESGMYFNTGLFSHTTFGLQDDLAQYGYAWKRVAFKIHAKTTNVASTFTAPTVTATNGFLMGNNIEISGITATYSAKVDGQISAAVYYLKNNNVLEPIVLRDGTNAGAEVVSTIAFKRSSYTMPNLYFIPSHSGEYLLVTKTKDFTSSQVKTNITKITIGTSEEYYGNLGPSSVSPAEAKEPDKTMALGESLTIPDVYIRNAEGKLKYATRNRDLYAYDANGVLDTSTVVGNCVVTVMGVSDPDCITGNKFTPNKSDETYKFKFQCYLSVGNKLIYTNDEYSVYVNAANGTSNILVDEAYDDEPVLWANGVKGTSSTLNHLMADGITTYAVGENGTGTQYKPAYAITLNQFVLANHGGATDFVVDSAYLGQYLEPMVEGGVITEYRYPAIAIPMPNVVAGNTSAENVEITVQKSNSTSDYLVSTKMKNAGNSSNKASLIAQNKNDFNGYYVFRPEGTFKADYKDTTKYKNYLLAGDNVSGVYTVTYKTPDTTVSYNITIGNRDNGTISWKKGFLTYRDGDEVKNITATSDQLKIKKDDNGHRYVTIDMSKLYFTGNADMETLISEGPNGSKDNTTSPYEFNSASSNPATEYYWHIVEVVVKLDNGKYINLSEWSEDANETKAIKNHIDYTYKFDLTESGTYEVSFTMKNTYTNQYVANSIEFTLDAKAADANTVDLNTVWGIILIVLSVGLLSGVVFYFVKTARATRFVDAPRIAKGKDKKDSDKSVATPKDVEAPKKDAK